MYIRLLFAYTAYPAANLACGLHLWRFRFTGFKAY